MNFRIMHNPLIGISKTIIEELAAEGRKMDDMALQENMTDEDFMDFSRSVQMGEEPRKFLESKSLDYARLQPSAEQTVRDILPAIARRKPFILEELFKRPEAIQEIVRAVHPAMEAGQVSNQAAKQQHPAPAPQGQNEIGHGVYQALGEMQREKAVRQQLRAAQTSTSSSWNTPNRGARPWNLMESYQALRNGYQALRQKPSQDTGQILPKAKQTSGSNDAFGQNPQPSEGGLWAASPGSPVPPPPQTGIS